MELFSDTIGIVHTLVELNLNLDVSAISKDFSHLITDAIYLSLLWIIVATLFVTSVLITALLPVHIADSFARRVEVIQEIIQEAIQETIQGAIQDVIQEVIYSIQKTPLISTAFRHQRLRYFKLWLFDALEGMENNGDAPHLRAGEGGVLMGKFSSLRIISTVEFEIGFMAISADEHNERLVSGNSYVFNRFTGRLKLASCVSDGSDEILLYVGRPPASTIDSIRVLCCRANVLRTDMIVSSGGILCALITQYTTLYIGYSN